MLIIRDRYESLNEILNLTNESLASDKFEKKCVHFLKKNYPDHKFVLKGGNNRMFSDILVDDSFYIECKMTENGKKKDGAQITCFNLLLDKENKFEIANRDKSDLVESSSNIIEYINSNFDSFSKLVNQNSKVVNIDLDKRVLSNYIHEFYDKKNVKFFITTFENKLVLFRNTSAKIEKYFDISASVRYVSNGTHNLPKNMRDSVSDFLKKRYKLKDIHYDGAHTIITSADPIEEKYIDFNDSHLYISDYNLDENAYRVMKLADKGSPRVLLKVKTKRNQDASDLESFEKYIRG